MAETREENAPALESSATGEKAARRQAPRHPTTNGQRRQRQPTAESSWKDKLTHHRSDIRSKRSVLISPCLLKRCSYRKDHRCMP
ncbi:hypothetical protein X946_4560 [Burkholderia sp. ABCPW 111]|nr:hypothetical protein X946_4560 [Burkholderia sp. ABCPW 111]